ncbi:MAG: hypothetical protein GEV10_08690 [Streptosporangiales bacterium]|nr:hypothetical protein [Streptosporangiales bacterium]
MTDRTARRDRLPMLLVVPAGVVLLQGLVAAVLGVLVGVDALRGGADNLPAAEIMAAFGLVAGVCLVLVGRGLLLRRRWGRAPALVTQIICVPVAVAVVQAGQYVVGVALGVLAVGAACCLMSRSSSEVLDTPEHGGRAPR